MKQMIALDEEFHFETHNVIQRTIFPFQQAINWPEIPSGSREMDL